MCNVCNNIVMKKCVVISKSCMYVSENNEKKRKKNIKEKSESNINNV